MTLRGIMTGLVAGALAAGGVSAAEEAAYSWQRPHATVKEFGDLEWAPRAFEFSPGASVRYIDYADGSDDNAGTARDAAWKHHPWDPAATGKAKACSGVHTYVFKRGVIYRGELVGKESGTPAEPIRLTSDPSWGKGETVLAGSEPATGWARGKAHKDIPDGEKVWSARLEFAPRSVWMVADGKITRLTLARTPNWTIKDPEDVKAMWWQWENPRWWTGTHKMTVHGKKMHEGIDREHLTKSADYYEGGLVWSEWGIVMGTPYPSKIEKYNPQNKSIAFQGFWYGDSGQIIRGNRYYLEDKPHYLDEAGEFWFDKSGRGGTLHVRLPGDRDPSGVRIEAAKRHNIIDSPGMSHVHVTGLTFRFVNPWWDLSARPFVHEDIDNACVRMLGTGRDLRVSNCRFEHVTKAVRFQALADTDELDEVVITDNDIREADHGAITVADSSRWGKKDPPFGPLGRVEILRNRLYRVGLRPARSENGHAVVVNFPAVAEIAGNVLDRCWGAGLFIFGGKGSGQKRDLPFTRILIHHNKVTDPLLNTNDWGGIETWQGGPFYVYNNISGNPGGYWNWAYNETKPASARFGHAYYLDGSFKNYHFNNIAWGKSSDPFSRLGNSAAFQEIHSYQNTFANNTVYNFVKGTRRQSPHAGRDKFLGNVWQGIGEWLFWHAQPARSEPEGNAAHAGKQKEQFDSATNAYGHNVFYDVSEKFGVFEPSGRWHTTLESFVTAVRAIGALAVDVGVTADKPILRDAENHDFRPAAGSAAIDRGVKHFVPWSLYAVVGEWNFTPVLSEPTRILDEHWYMTSYYVGREDYWSRPMFPLTGVNVTADSYVDGPLESWTRGALKLDGKSVHAVGAHDKLAEPFGYETAGKPVEGGWVTVTAPKAVMPGEKFTVQLKLDKAIPGQKIAAHLHWLKKGGFGGFNAWGGLPKDATAGTHEFTFPSADKPELDQFSLLVYLSPDGEFKNKTRQAHVRIAKAAEAGKAGAQTVAIGAGDKTTVRKEAPLKSANILESSFAVEVYFRTEPGHTGGGLVCKSDGKSGYELALDGEGRAVFTVRTGRAVSVASKAAVNDGKWHHVLAERDAPARALRLYVDGKQVAEAKHAAAGGSVANEADLLVGKGAGGTYFAGELEFLRIALGTLADAKTTIEELYAWQFDGPFLRDFTGRAPSGKARDAGALEHPGE